MGNPTRTTRGNVGVSAAATGGSCSRPVVLRHILEKCIFVCFNIARIHSMRIHGIHHVHLPIAIIMNRN
jgi:hypothetical protein